MHKLDLEMAEERELKLPAFAGSLKKQGNCRKTSASLIMLQPLTVWNNSQIFHNKLENSRDGNTRPPYLLPDKHVCRSRSNSYNQTWNSWKLGRSHQNCISSPGLFKLYAENILLNVGLAGSEAGSKIARTNNNLRHVDDTTIMAEIKEDLKNFLMRVKDESKNAGLKLNIQKNKIIHPVPSLHGK